MRSINALLIWRAPIAESLFKKPGMISALFLNRPSKPTFATSAGCILNFSARSAKASMPARCAKLVLVGPGQRQLTDTIFFNSTLSARLKESTNALVAAYTA